MELRILCIDFGLCNFHNLVSLAEAGHKVYVATTFEEPPRAYLKSLGIKSLATEIVKRDSKLLQWIDKSAIDLIINTSPRNSHLYPNLERRADYIGLTPDASKLETNKFFVRESVEKLGIKTPRLLDTPTFPCVMKPKDTLVQYTDYAQICLTRESYENVEKGDTTFAHYLEEYIPDNVETNVAYAISGGKWSIMHTQEVIGEDVAKQAGNFLHWTNTSSFAKLSTEDERLAIENAETYLNWAVQFGGDYVGQITGLVKDGEWYFCENNVRPEQTNSLPYFITGDEWLEGMRGNPDIIGDAFPNDVQKMIVMPNEANSIYPFHLHEKYGVAIPCGLDIIDGKYMVADMVRARAVDERIGIIICDREIPLDFIEDLKNNSNFSVSHCFI